VLFGVFISVDRPNDVTPLLMQLETPCFTLLANSTSSSGFQYETRVYGTSPKVRSVEVHWLREAE